MTLALDVHIAVLVVMARDLVQCAYMEVVEFQTYGKQLQREVRSDSSYFFKYSTV